MRRASSMYKMRHPRADGFSQNALTQALGYWL